jgi:hypothetical protein
MLMSAARVCPTCQCSVSSGSRYHNRLLMLLPFMPLAFHFRSTHPSTRPPTSTLVRLVITTMAAPGGVVPSLLRLIAVLARDIMWDGTAPPPPP